MLKTILVSGAGRGIGRAVALSLINSGYDVSGCARTLSELEESKRLSEGRLRINRVDVTNESQVSNWMQKEFETKSVWGLVTAAGIVGAVGKLVDVPFSEWKAGVEVNLFGSVLCAQVFSKNLIARKSPGRIVMFSGGGGTQARPHFSSYAASKSAVVRVAETLAEELKEHNITVNSIAPGAICTKMTDDVFKLGPQRVGKEFPKVLEQIKTGGGDVKKAAALIGYLMSDEAAPVTGRLIAAQWDNWSNLHKNESFLKNVDTYTLRRAMPTPDQNL